MVIHDPVPKTDGHEAIRKPESIILRWIDNFLEFLCAALLIEIVILLFANVLARYVFTVSLHWADETVRYSFTWLCFLSGALVMRFGGHMAMDMFTDMFPRRTERTMRVLVECAVIAFLCALVFYGWQMAMISAGQKSSTLRISMVYVYLSAPVGSAFMLYYSVRRLITFLQGSATMRLDEKETLQ